MITAFCLYLAASNVVFGQPTDIAKEALVLEQTGDLQNEVKIPGPEIALSDTLIPEKIDKNGKVIPKPPDEAPGKEVIPEEPEYKTQSKMALPKPNDKSQSELVLPDQGNDLQGKPNEENSSPRESVLPDHENISQSKAVLPEQENKLQSETVLSDQKNYSQSEAVLPNQDYNLQSGVVLPGQKNNSQSETVVPEPTYKTEVNLTDSEFSEKQHHYQLVKRNETLVDVNQHLAENDSIDSRISEKPLETSSNNPKLETKPDQQQQIKLDLPHVIPSGSPETQNEDIGKIKFNQTKTQNVLKVNQTNLDKPEADKSAANKSETNQTNTNINKNKVLQEIILAAKKEHHFVHLGSYKKRAAGALTVVVVFAVAMVFVFIYYQFAQKYGERSVLRNEDSDDEVIEFSQLSDVTRYYHETMKL